MFCTSCGTQLPDGTKFCPACGTKLAEPEQPSQTYAAPEPAPVMPDYQYQQSGTSYGSDVANPEYKKMGGWLLFFMVINIISGVYNVIYSGIYTLATTAPYLEYISAFGGGGLSGIVIFSCIVALVVGVLALVFVYFVFKKNPIFLKFYQIVQIVSIVLSIVMLIGLNAAIGDMGMSISDTGINVAPSIIGGIVGLVLMTMYYCKSVRVRTYMGSDEHIKNALFRIGA